MNEYKTLKDCRHIGAESQQDKHWRYVFGPCCHPPLSFAAVIIEKTPEAFSSFNFSVTGGHIQYKQSTNSIKLGLFLLKHGLHCGCGIPNNWPWGVWTFGFNLKFFCVASGLGPSHPIITPGSGVWRCNPPWWWFFQCSQFIVYSDIFWICPVQPRNRQFSIFQPMTLPHLYKHTSQLQLRHKTVVYRFAHIRSGWYVSFERWGISFLWLKIPIVQEGHLAGKNINGDVVVLSPLICTSTYVLYKPCSWNTCNIQLYLFIYIVNLAVWWKSIFIVCMCNFSSFSLCLYLCTLYIYSTNVFMYMHLSPSLAFSLNSIPIPPHRPSLFQG